MESVVDYRRLIQDHTPQSLRLVGARVANLASTSETVAPTVEQPETTEEPNINTADYRASLTASISRFGGSLALLGANTGSMIIEHGLINTGSTILEPAIVAGSGLLAAVVHKKKQELRSAYETIYDLLYVSDEEAGDRSKFRPLNSDSPRKNGEGLGTDRLNFARAFEEKFKAAANGKSIHATAKVKSKGKTEELAVEEVLKVNPSTKFGHFNVIIGTPLGSKRDYKTIKKRNYRAIRDVPYNEMNHATGTISYKKKAPESVDKKPNLLYTLPLLRTSVFINLIRKGRRVLSLDSTR